MLVELSANAGRVLTYGHLLRRVWGVEGDADVRPMRTAISAIRRELGDDADNPAYIFTELRVGYKMPKPDTPRWVEPGQGGLVGNFRLPEDCRGASLPATALADAGRADGRRPGYAR